MEEKKLVFVYGILRQGDTGAKYFDIKPEDVVGKAKLYGFERVSVSYIRKSDNPQDFVEGEVINISKEKEKEIYRFERYYGYKRRHVDVTLEDGRTLRTIVYLVQIMSKKEKSEEKEKDGEIKRSIKIVTPSVEVSLSTEDSKENMESLIKEATKIIDKYERYIKERQLDVFNVKKKNKEK